MIVPLNLKPGRGYTKVNPALFNGVYSKFIVYKYCLIMMNMANECDFQQQIDEIQDDKYKSI